MPSYAIIYTCCAALKGGDFAAAAKEAYAQHKKLPTSTLFIFMSTTAGVAKIKQMFPSATGGSCIDLWGLQATSLSIAEAKRDISPDDVSHFTEVGWCKPLDDGNVRHWCKPHVTVTFVGLACYEDMAGITLNMLYKHPSLFTASDRPEPTSPRKIRHLGFGLDRCGQPLILPALPALSETTRGKLGASGFGFAYLDCIDVKGYDKAAKTFKQYLKLLAKMALTNQVVIISPKQTLNDAITSYLSQSSVAIGSTVQIYHEKTGKHVIAKKVASNEIAFVPASTIAATAAPLFSIVCYSSLSNLQMQKHLEQAVSVVMLPGVESTHEALGHGKLCFYQFAPKNQTFIKGYQAEVIRLIDSSDYSTADKTTLSTCITLLCSPKSLLGARDIITLASALTPQRRETLRELSLQVIKASHAKFCTEVLDIPAQDLCTTSTTDTPLASALTTTNSAVMATRPSTTATASTTTSASTTASASARATATTTRRQTTSTRTLCSRTTSSSTAMLTMQQEQQPKRKNHPDPAPRQMTNTGQQLRHGYYTKLMLMSRVEARKEVQTKTLDLVCKRTTTLA